MIEQSESELLGSWHIVGGKMIEDQVCQRIRSLVATELRPIAVSSDGWEKLYLDQNDNRYWEWFYPKSEMQGGGPPSLRVIPPEAAKEKYHLANSNS